MDRCCRSNKVLGVQRAVVASAFASIADLELMASTTIQFSLGRVNRPGENQEKAPWEQLEEVSSWFLMKTLRERVVLSISTRLGAEKFEWDIRADHSL